MPGAGLVKVRVGRQSFRIDKASIWGRGSTMLEALLRFNVNVGDDGECSGDRKRRRRGRSLRVDFRERNADVFGDVYRWYCGGALHLTAGYSVRSVLSEWDFWGIDPLAGADPMHMAVLPSSWGDSERISRNLARIAISIAEIAREAVNVLHEGHVLVFPTEGWYQYKSLSPVYEDDISALSHSFVRQLLVFQLCRASIDAKFVSHPPTCNQLPGHRRWTYAILKHWVVGDAEAQTNATAALRSMRETECARCKSKCRGGCWRSEERTKRATLCIDIRMVDCVDE